MKLWEVSFNMSLFAYGNKAKCEGQFMEDSCYVGRIGKYVVLMVADGNGSTSGNVDSGVLVTTIASDWLSHAILNPDGSEKNVNLDMIGESLDSMIFGLSRCFITMAALEEKYSSLYASLIVCVIDELSLEMVSASIGNCELHKVSAGNDNLVNTIHSVAYEEYKKGKLGEDWRENPKRGMLTSAIGAFNEPVVDILKTNLNPDDILYLTTDGLLHVTGPAGILEELFNHSDDISKATDAVLQKAEDLKCPDNCALIVGYVNDDVRGRETANQQNQRSQEPPRRQSVLDNDGNNARGSVQTYQRGQYETQRQSSSRQQESVQAPRQRRGSRRH